MSGSILDFLRPLGAEPAPAGSAGPFPAPSCGCAAAPRAARTGGGEKRAHAPKEPRSARGEAAELQALTEAALAPLELRPDECAGGSAPGAPCASRKVLQVVARFAGELAEQQRDGGQGGDGKPQRGAPAAPPAETLPTAPTAEAAAVRAAAAALGCAAESCVLGHPAFRRYAADAGLDRAALGRELAVNFKAAGPRDSLALLSDTNIDETLRRWAREFEDFFPCPFAMMDFDATQEPFAALDLGDVLAGRAAADLGAGVGRVRRPARTFGCVVNTDTSAGPGKHWVAVFVDCRPGPGRGWSVEYFNSAGRPPPRPMAGWMERSRARLQAVRAARGEAGGVESVAVTDVDHQLSNTECGLYALYYIRRRLEGGPFTAFFAQRVPDEAMTAFRRYVFRAA